MTMRPPKYDISSYAENAMECCITRLPPLTIVTKIRWFRRMKLLPLLLLNFMESVRNLTRFRTAIWITYRLSNAIPASKTVPSSFVMYLEGKSEVYLWALIEISFKFRKCLHCCWFDIWFWHWTMSQCITWFFYSIHRMLRTWKEVVIPNLDLTAHAEIWDR